MDSFDKFALDMMASGEFNMNFINPKDRVSFFAECSRFLKKGVKRFRVAQIADFNKKGIDSYMRIKHLPGNLKKFDTMVKVNSGRKYYVGFDYEGDM